LLLDGISEEMDEDISDIFENVTEAFLNEQLAESTEVGEVAVLVQSVVEGSQEDTRRLQLQQRSLGRQLGGNSTTSSLSVRLGITGTVFDWQALGSDSVLAAISKSLSTKGFRTSLVDASDFFPYETSKSSLSKAVGMAEPESSNSNVLLLILVGAAVAVAVLVGSMVRGRSGDGRPGGSVFHSVRSGQKRPRREVEDSINGDAMQVQAYDLNDLDAEEGREDLEFKYEENSVELVACSPSEREENKESPGKANKESPRKAVKESPKKAPPRKPESVNDSRMTSLLDNVSFVCLV
jgi:hypothetical protein